MLSPVVLQKWSGLCLDQRCILLAREFNLPLTKKGLQLFYQKNNIRYLVVSYQYQQAALKDPAELESFVVELAKLTRSGQPLIYFDEASFNLWLRNRRTWCSPDEPVKMMLNKSRGNGITVMGAISK